MAVKLTALDFVTDMRGALGNVPTDRVTNAQLLQKLNLAYKRVCSKWPQPELDQDITLTTVAAQAYNDSTVPVTNVLRWGRPVNITTSNPLEYISRDMYDYLERGQAAPGSPYKYHVHPGATGYHRFQWWPIPAAAESIRVPYDLNPAELVLSPAETSTVIAPAWDQVILAMATEYASAFVGDTQRAIYFNGVWKDMAKDIKPGTAQASELGYRMTPVRF